MGRLVEYFDRAAPFETMDAKRIFMHAIRTVERRWAETPEARFDEVIERDEGPYG